MLVFAEEKPGILIDITIVLGTYMLMFDSLTLSKQPKPEKKGVSFKSRRVRKSEAVVSTGRGKARDP